MAENIDVGTTEEKPGLWNKISSAFDNPNFQMGMANLGALTSGGDPNLMNMSNVAKGMIKDSQMQKAAAKQQAGKKSQVDELLALIQSRDGDNMVGGKADDIPTKITMDGNKINFTYDNRISENEPTEKENLFGIKALTDDPLEGLKDFNIPDAVGPRAGIQKTSSYEGLTEEDFAGLGAKEIQLLMAGDAESDALRRELLKNAQMELKYGRDTEAAKKLAIAKKLAAKQKRKEVVTDREDKQAFDEWKLYREQGGKEELAKLNAKLKKGQPLSEADKIRWEQLKVAMAKLGLDINKFSYEKEQDIKQQERDNEFFENEDTKFVLDKTEPIEQRESVAKTINQKGGNRFLFKHDKGYFGKEAMVEYIIPSGLTYKGQPVTAANLPKIAKDKGISVQELITQMENR